MSERPILFSGPMVRAILEGRKTQTRRVVKPQPPGDDTHSARLMLESGIAVKCPYGQPGDRLWVRETWYCDDAFAGDLQKARSFYVSAPPPSDEALIEQWKRELYYRADVKSGRFEDAGYWGEPGSHWKPSIHMPRWASRITLEITGVRVERLQEISEEDAKAEGCSGIDGDMTHYWKGVSTSPCPRAHFMNLWDSINAERAPWSSKPWVWVIEFKRVTA